MTNEANSFWIYIFKKKNLTFDERTEDRNKSLENLNIINNSCLCKKIKPTAGEI